MLSGYQYWRRITSTHQSSTFFYLFWLWLRTSQYLFGDGYCRFLTYRANGKIRSIFIVTKARKLARNWRGIEFYCLSLISVFSFRFSLFPPLIFVKLVNTLRCFCFKLRRFRRRRPSPPPIRYRPSFARGSRF